VCQAVTLLASWAFHPTRAQKKSRHGEPVRLFDEAEKAD
jgi:hypothetical protein